ncbi:ABC transporter permease subunit [bacterium]|nr:ABC transporter permease subunit [bacterium]
MQGFLTLVRREIGGYFNSFTGYVVLAVVLLLIGLSFAEIVSALNGQPSSLPVTQLYYQTYYFWLILLLASPVITMRSFALEKDLGTFETLMTAPVSDRQVVGAKFIGALIFYVIIFQPLLICVLVLRYFGGAQGAFDYGLLASTGLGILLLGCLYMSMGVFASSLTRSQVTAAMISFAFGLSLFVLSFASATQTGETGTIREMLGVINLRDHMEAFAAGIIDTRAVILQLSLTAMFLFLTLRVVESRRWK